MKYVRRRLKIGADTIDNPDIVANFDSGAQGSADLNR